MVQSKFNLNARFNSYSFFVLNLHACGDVMVVVLSYMHANSGFSLLCAVYIYECYIARLMAN